jgi:hypothetical protein
MGEIIMRKWDLREIRVGVNLPYPIVQVWVLNGCVNTPIWGHPNPIRQVVPLITHLWSHPPYHSDLHPPSLPFSSTTPLSSQNTKLSHPFLSHLIMIFSWHRVLHKPSTAYTEYSSPSTAHTEYSIHPWLLVFPSFSWLWDDPWM